MTNTNPIWKILLLAVVLVVGALYALPNLFGSDPAVQVSGRNADLSSQDISRIERLLNAEDFPGVEFRQEDPNRFLALFPSEDEQIKARDVVAAEFDPNEYTTTLNLEPASPEWLRAIAEPMNLGLDLRGGVHFLMEVDMDSVIASAEESYVPVWKRETREAGHRGVYIAHDDDALVARFKEEAKRDQMLNTFAEDAFDLEFDTSEDDEYFYITANLTELAAQEERTNALQQNVVTLRNRINELGVSEPVIQQQGADRIVVQLPGVQDTARAKEIIGATATLEYRLVSTSSDARTYQLRDGGTVSLDRDIIVTGDQIKGASSGIDQSSGTPAVFVNLDNAGARRMQDVTQDNVGNPMAVVYIENRVDTKEVDGELLKTVTKVEEVINVATIRDVLSHRFQTTGLGLDEAADLALLLRAGALKAPVQIVEERTVGPSLGKENIRQGFMSAAVGLALVVVFMGIYYRVFGLIAGAALVVNVVLIIAILGLLQATLTLPGIAGIVLTMGMAVDANVLIFERIREEIRQGGAIQAAISAGYDKAFVTIADANITTLIAAIVLFSMGTGPIKGFAITLCLGILTSMFTAIFGSRVLVNMLYGGRRLSSLPI